MFASVHSNIVMKLQLLCFSPPPAVIKSELYVSPIKLLYQWRFYEE